MSIKKIINKSVVLYTLYIFITGLFFLWYLFPSEYFAGYIEKAVAANVKGVSIEIGAVKPFFPAGVKLTDVNVIVSSIGQPIKLDYIKAKAGLLSLIKFAPEISLSTGLFGGRVKCRIKVPEGNVNNLAVTDISVKGLNLESVSALAAEKLPGYSLKGRLNATGEYSVAGRGHGKIGIDLKDIIIKRDEPFLTLESLTFSNVKADIEVKSKRIDIKECVITGKEFDGSIKGPVVFKQPLGRTVLRLSGTFNPSKEFAETMPLDIVFKKKVKPGEEQKFKITGTVKKPRFK